MSRLLYGIGAGPGDPELMTLLGLRLLRSASTVFLPSTREGASFVRSIVDDFLDIERQRIVELVCPAYRNRVAVESRWQELAQVVAGALADGTSGAFICEGDPSLYSTFVHLRRGLERLQSDIEISVVPGVSAVSAAAAVAGVPLAMWDERLLITPAVHDPEAMRTLLGQAETVAMLKAGGSLEQIAGAIDAQGSSIRSALVRRVGRPEEQVLRDTASMGEGPPDYFTTILLRRTEP